jgi:regulator of protease activity HflC (stomatin/prohibitin superfamily)
MTEILDYPYLVIVLALGIFSIIGGIHVVPEYQRLVVFRLGRYLDKPKGPGIAFLVPMIDRAVKVDLREQKREISNQEATTKDFIPVFADFRWYYKVLDPIKAVVSVGNVEATTAGIISTKLRKIIHEINAGDLLSEHERIRYEISTDTSLREVFENLGVIVTRFEILKLSAADRKK